MNMIKVGVLGGTGYAGEELIRLLHTHKGVEVVRIMSDTYQEKHYNNPYRNFTNYSNIVCEKVDFSTITEGIDVLFSSLPYGVLMQHLNKEILDKIRVIDIGVDYRFVNSEEYLKYYKKEHQSVELAKEFTYGLCEWNRKKIKSSRHIANPGCFATAMELAIMPLIKENIVFNNIIIDGKSSLSGAGRALSLGTHYTESNESTKPFKILNHPHAREVKKAVNYFTDKAIDLTFVPHIVPMQRGILVSCYLKANKDVNYDMIKNIYDKYYEKEKFVAILDKGMYVETKWVKSSNMCHINFDVDEESGMIVVFSAIDNLIKGAAGQAIQNMNLIYGLNECEGLDFIPTCI